MRFLPLPDITQLQKAVDRWMPRLDIRENGCWEWTGSLNNGRYGRMGIGKRLYYAHRVFYAALVGEIPAGLELDHLCSNGACVNPAHLEPVDRRTNSRRGWDDNRPFFYVRSPIRGWDKRPRPEACPKGHPYTLANTGTRRTGKRAGHIYCLACNEERRQRQLGKVTA